MAVTKENSDSCSVLVGFEQLFSGHGKNSLGVYDFIPDFKYRD